MDPTVGIFQNSEYSTFLNHCKKNNVPICNLDIFALLILGVKCCFHPRNDHVKPIQHTFTVKHGPETKVHVLKKK